MTIYVIGPKDKYLKSENSLLIDTTSRGKYSKDFSPFILGPVIVNNELIALNMENFWQFSKVYKDHVDQNNNPCEKYFEWRDKGFKDKKPHRYPKGRGAIPLYSLDYKTKAKLSYINARKQIYIPYYRELVQKTEGFKRLQDYYNKFNSKDIYLWDFDGYNHLEKKMTLQDVIHSEKYKMGHAFIIYGLLTNQLDETLIEPTITQKDLFNLKGIS